MTGDGPRPGGQDQRTSADAEQSGTGTGDQEGETGPDRDRSGDGYGTGRDWSDGGADGSRHEGTLGRRRAVLAGVLTLVGVALVGAPDAVQSIPPFGALAGALDGVGATGVAVSLAALVALAAVLSTRSTAAESGAREDPFRVTRERAANRPQQVGAATGRQIDRACDRGGEDLDAVRARLRRAAVAAVAGRRSVPESRAETLVAAGEWTDDAAAAAFVGDPPATVQGRIRAWVDPPAERRRRIETAIDAVATVRNGGVGVTRSDRPRDGSDGTLAKRAQEGIDGGLAKRGRDASGGIRANGQWGGAAAATLLLLALGLLFASPTLLLVGLVPLGFAAYGSLSAVPSAAAVDCTRRFDAEGPAPGDAVRVTLTVENTGGTALPDLRVVDGVPSGLAVRDGSPRLATALAPGERATCTYEVVARRGEHAFDDPTVRLRSLAGGDVRTARIPPDGDRSLRAVDPIDAPADRDARSPGAGRQPTGRGSGVEFHATREYRPGDPADRIDWRRYAKSGDLATVEFRAERGVRTVIVLDGRTPGRVVPGPGEPTVAERCAHAAAGLRAAVADGTGTVELLGLGVDAADVDAPLPSGDPPRATDRAGATALLRAVVAAAESGRGLATRGTPAGTDAVERLVDGLHPTAQVIMCSPLLDDRAAALARRVAAGGHPLVVVSPGPEEGADESPGATVETLERAARIDAVERHGSVVDWDPDEGPARVVGRTLDRLRRVGP